MRIGLVGDYGHGNFSGSLYHECFKRYFPSPEYDLEILENRHPGNAEITEASRPKGTEPYDAVIIGGGDLVVPGDDLSARYFWEGLRSLPAFVASVGVARWTGYNEQALLHLKDFFRSPDLRQITARDRESAQWLNGALKPRVACEFFPDVVFALADMMERRVSRPEEFNNIGIIVRHGEELAASKIPALIGKLSASGKHVKLIVTNVGAEMGHGQIRAEALGVDGIQGVEVMPVVSALELLPALNAIDCLYSEEFHGCVLGLMANIPTIGMRDRDDFQILYRSFGLDRYLVSSLSDDLPGTVESIAQYPEVNIHDTVEDARRAMDLVKSGVDEVRVDGSLRTGELRSISPSVKPGKNLTMKRLGLVGYYGHGNFGDELFLHAFRRVFPLNEYRIDLLGRSGGIMRKYQDSRLENIQDKYDAIIIGGGDLLIPGYDVSDQYFLKEFLQVPVFIHGVGVPTWTAWTGTDAKACEKMKSFLRHESVQSICVRDRESKEWLTRNIKPRIKVAYAEDIVFSLLDTVDFNYRRTSEIERIGIVMRGGQNKSDCKMKEFVHSLLQRGYSLRFLMLGTGKELDYDLAAVEKLECMDSDRVDVLVRQSDVDLLHSFDGLDAVYSMKFHGCIASLMHGIPTFALITTDKFVNLYKRLGIERYVIHHTNENIFESINAVADFPKLNLDEMYLSSATALYSLKTYINAAVLSSMRGQS